jgi:cephalosporin-C deacetylase
MRRVRGVSAFVAAGVIALSMARLCAAEELAFEPIKPGGIYAPGERVGWTIRAPAGSGDTTYTYVVRKNNFEVIKQGTLDLSKPAVIEVTLQEPAMLYTEVRSPGSDAPVRVLGAAIAPERMRSAEPEPRDFDRFWASKLRQLKAIPLNPVVTPKDSGRPDVEYFTFQLDHIEGRKVHGQMARPKHAGPFPGMVIFQWASPPYPLQKQWVTDRAAEGWLAVNIEPHDVLPDAPQSYYDALPDELKNYQEIGRDDRDRNYFLQMYLADYRAVDFLASLKEWNGRTLLVTGTSMGGQQSLCAAAFHPRVTDLIVHMPAGADASGPLHGRASGYPNWPVEHPEVRATAQYFDSANCAARVKVPSLVSMGFIDTVTPPAGIWIAFNRIRGPKEAVPLIEAAHNHQSTPEQQAAFTSRAAEWMRTLAAGGRVFEPADKPSPRLDENSRIAHEQLLAKRKQGQIDLYFLGDSITRRWGAAEPKYRELLAHWNASFHGWNAANFGWGGDKTQNILWRLENGELDGVNPKVIVLMAGTNNIGAITPVGGDTDRIAEVTRGIEAIVKLCRRKAPHATIILMGITPRNDNMAVMPTINRINENLARLANGATVRYLNINPKLADEHGRLRDGMTDPDKLHLALPAYQIWAEALEPLLTELLGPRASIDRAPPPTGDPSAMR